MSKIREILAQLIEKCVDCIGAEECKRDIDITQAEQAINKTRLTEEEIIKLLVKEISTTYEGEIDIGSDMTKLAHAIYEAGREKGEE